MAERPAHAPLFPERLGKISDRLAAELRSRLLAKEWPVGTAIPSETALAATYQVSRNTVREALARLIAEGSLRVQRGVGTIVEEKDPMQIDIGQFRSLTNASTQGGKALHFEVNKVQRRKPTELESKRLDCKPSDQIVYVERATYAGDVVSSFAYERYPVHVISEEVDAAFFERSFLDILAARNLASDVIEVEYHAVNAPIGWGKHAEDSRLYLLVDRVHRCAGQPILFSQTYYVEGLTTIRSTIERH